MRTIIFTLILQNTLCCLSAQSWSTSLEGLGTFSSPRVADLNADGVKDIVLGAGRQEFIDCDTAVIALDGKTGALIWHVRSSDQIFGSANFMDITADRIPDVFINGRSAELMAINGKSGQLIWDFFPAEDSVLARKNELYNFYNPQFIPDQDGDGLQDILIANGGDVTAPAFDPDRPPGHLMVISSRTGRQLAKAPMPDGKEIYMSAVVDDLDGDGRLDVIYGTGGETVGGNLFRTTLDAVIAEDLSGSDHIASGAEKGFVAPPAIVDINQDSIKDIIVHAVDGRMLAFNGKDNSVIWAGRIPDTEAYSSPAIGDITGDGIPDVFANFAIGVWPNMEATRPFLVDGQKGEILFIDSIGFYQLSSPVIADFNDDGRNDVLVNLNFFAPNENQEKTIFNTLLIYDFFQRGKYALGEQHIGSNVGSTPWVGDLDDDGLLDIIYCHMTTPDETYTYDGFEIHRLELSTGITNKPPWGAYMGTAYTGIYQE